MTTPRQVLVPIDFSAASLRALDYGLTVAKAFSAHLSLLHVINRAMPARYGQFVPTAEEEATHITQAEQDLRQLVTKSKSSHLDYSVKVLLGEIDQQILRAVDEQSVDLVIMGSHGRRGFTRWFVGSVTERVLREIPVPLMTVATLAGKTSPVPEGPVRLDRILCPSDFTDSEEVALPLAVEFAKRFDSELEIVHVVEHLKRSPTSAPYTAAELVAEQEVLITNARSKLEDVASRVGSDSVTVRKTVLEGHASDAILSHATASGASLLVITLHRMNFVERALVGATAERLVRTASIPVLTVPRTQGD